MLHFLNETLSLHPEIVSFSRSQYIHKESNVAIIARMREAHADLKSEWREIDVSAYEKLTFQGSRIT